MLVLFLLLFLNTFAHGQIICTSLTTGGDSACSGSSTTASISPDSNALILACFTQEHASAAGTAQASGNSLTYAEVGTVVSADSRHRTTLYRSLGLTPSAGTLTFTTSQDEANCTWAVAQCTETLITGTNGSGAVVQSNTNSAGSATSLTVTLSSSFADSTNNVAFGCFGANQNIAITAGSGFAEVGSQATGFGSRTMNEWRTGEDLTVDVTHSTAQIAGVAIEIGMENARKKEAPRFYSLLDWFLWAISPAEAEAATIYVDAGLASDCTSGNYSTTNRTCSGSSGNAYNDFQEACSAATASDDITIRSGVYRRAGSNKIVYDCLLDGTNINHIVVTAQTCSANTPGCYLAGDGVWYESVIFDNGRVLNASWSTTATSNVYQATINFPAYTTTSAAWLTDQVTLAGTNTTGSSPLRVASDPINYGFTSFAPGPYRLLQDDMPSKWYDYDYTLTAAQNAARLTAEGTHTYNKDTKVLYVHLRGNKNPSTSGATIETWENEDAWMRCRCDYVDFRGLIVRLWLKLWPLVNNDTTSYQTNVTYQGMTFVDNLTMIQDPRGMRFTEFAGSVTQTGATTYALRSAVSFQYSRFIRASREIFQFHGDNNVFQYNDVFDKTSQWSGGFDSFPGTNTRNNEASIIGENWFHGHIDSYRTAVILNTETTAEHDNVTGDGNCQFNNQVFRGNLITEFQRSGPMVIGGVTNFDGHCALTNFDTTRNIFYNLNTSSNTDAIDIRSNLTGGSDFSRNLFYEKSSGDTIEMPSGSRAATLTNDLIFDRNIFYNQDTVFNTRVCNATGVTLTNNLFNGNTSNGCTGTGAVTSAPTFVDVDRFDFRPASAGSAQVITGNDIGPYNQGESVPTGMDFWTRRDALAPSVVGVKVEEGATSTVVVDFALGLPRFSFGPILAADGAAPTVAADCAGLTFRKNGTSNTITDCEQVTETQWAATVTNAYACGDTVDYSYDSSVGHITDSAQPSELRLELSEATNVSGSNLITSGCGGSPPNVPVFTLTEFRWKKVPGSASSTDWLRDLNTSITIAPGRHARLTTQVINSVAAGTFTPALYCSAAGGEYREVTDDCSSSALAPFCFVALPDISGTQDTLNLLTACGGTFSPGKVIRNASSHPPISFSLDGCSEMEWSLQLRPNVTTSSNPLRCRIYHSDGTTVPFDLPSDTFWAQVIDPRSYFVDGGIITGGGYIP